MAKLVRRYIRDEGISFINEEAIVAGVREGDGDNSESGPHGRRDECQP